MENMLDWNKHEFSIKSWIWGGNMTVTEHIISPALWMDLSRHPVCVFSVLQTAIKMSGSTQEEEELPANHTGQMHKSNRCNIH